MKKKPEQKCQPLGKADAVHRLDKLASSGSRYVMKEYRGVLVTS